MLFWYEQILKDFIPKENKIGRIISESEVIGAISYLQRQGKIINQKSVTEVVEYSQMLCKRV